MIGVGQPLAGAIPLSALQQLALDVEGRLLVALSAGTGSLNSDSRSFTPITGSCAWSAEPAGKSDKSAATNTSLRIVMEGF
jgi:hypothetical protein